MAAPALKAFNWGSIFAAILPAIEALIAQLFGGGTTPAAKAVALAQVGRIQAVVDKVHGLNTQLAAIDWTAHPELGLAVPTPAEIEAVVTDLENAVPPVIKLVTDVVALMNPAPAPAPVIPVNPVPNPNPS